MITLLISVMGFSQPTGKEFFQPQKQANQPRPEHHLQSFKNRDEREKVTHPQPNFPQRKTTAIQKPDDPKEIKQCLDSVCNESSKRIYSYDNMENMTLLESYYWDYDNNILILNYKYEYEYDINGNVIMEAYFYNYDYPSGYKSEYTYDNHRNIITETSYDWQNDTWVPFYKYVYTYDVNENPILFLVYNWNGYEWFIYNKIENTYNAAGNLTLRLYSYWSGEWIPYQKFEYQYDSYENEILYLHFDLEENVWVEQERATHEYTYDSNGNIIEEILHYWYWNAYLRYKTEQGYDENGNMILQAFYIWQDNAWEWNHTYEWQYDNNRNLIKQSYFWPDYGGKYEYEYDNNGNTISVISSYLYENVWVTDLKTEYEYDFSYSKKELLFFQNDFSNTNNMYNMRTKEKYFSFEGSKWEQYGERIYYWSPIDIEVGIKETTTLPSDLVKLYPNPVSTTLYIEIGNVKKKSEVKIYSIQGALLVNTKGNEIDVSSLPSGIYIVEVNGVCKKLVKQ